MPDGAAAARAGCVPAGPEPVAPAPAPASDPAAPRPVSAREWVGFLAMAFGMFMAILDIQIVSSSLPEIQAGLAASADEVSWIQTSYLIAEVVMIPLSGILSRILSTRVLFAASALGFTAMSLACAFAWNLEAMVAFRALQGFLGGAMIPTVFATSYALFPRERQAMVGVVIGLIATMAPTLGPTLGGYLTQAFSWHWLFLINLVPGAAVAALVWTCIDVDRGDRSLLRGFDVLGLLLMAAFLGSFEFVVEEGPAQDWFEDREILAMALVSAASGIGFFARALTYGRPVVELRAFRDRNFAIGCLYSFVIGIGLYGSVYITPLFLSGVRDLNSLQIGQVMAVTGAFQFLSAPVAGILSKRLDLRVMLALGLTLFGAGVWLNSFLTNESGFWELFLPQAVRGSSLMLCFIPINAIALGTLPPDQLKNASGLYNLMRNLGGAMGLAAINTVVTERFALHSSRLAEAVTWSRPEVQSWLDDAAARLSGALSPDAAQQAALRLAAGLVRREALVMTFSDCLLVMAGVFAAALLLMPLLRRPRAAVDGGH